MICYIFFLYQLFHIINQNPGHIQIHFYITLWPGAPCCQTLIPQSLHLQTEARWSKGLAAEASLLFCMRYLALSSAFSKAVKILQVQEVQTAQSTKKFLCVSLSCSLTHTRMQAHTHTPLQKALRNTRWFTVEQKKATKNHINWVLDLTPTSSA